MVTQARYKYRVKQKSAHKKNNAANKSRQREFSVGFSAITMKLLFTGKHAQPAERNEGSRITPDKILRCAQINTYL